MGAAAADVVQIYRDMGLQVRRDAHELPDHLTIELEALAQALEAGAAKQSSQLVDDHLALWVPAFCDAVAAGTAQPFYAELARLTPAWTAALPG
jgi:TorA maturation chaperone TorD